MFLSVHESEPGLNSLKPEIRLCLHAFEPQVVTAQPIDIFADANELATVVRQASA